jgi:hypothetical protein
MTSLPELLSPTGLRLVEATASDDGLALWSLACVSAGAAIVAITWALIERRERRALERRNDSLSLAARIMSEQHYRERLQTEERHLLAFDSAVRNILEYLERALVGKPRS